MSYKPSYLLMLQIEHGEKTPLPFNQENLSSESIIATIDEYNDSLYLWFGKECSSVRKRSAMRTAQSIKKSGYAYGDLHIGHDLKDLKIVDESQLNDPETRNNHTELIAIFKRKYTMKDKYVMEVGEKTQVVPFTPTAEQEAYTPPAPEPKIIVPAPTPAPAPELAPVDVTPEPEVAPAVEVAPEPVNTEAPRPVIDPELIGHIKLGLLSVVLAMKFSGFQLTTSLGSRGKPVYEFSSSAGSLCKVSLDGKDLVISPDSEFGGRRDEIINLLKQKVTLLNL